MRQPQVLGCNNLRPEDYLTRKSAFTTIFISFVAIQEAHKKLALG